MNYETNSKLTARLESFVFIYFTLFPHSCSSLEEEYLRKPDHIIQQIINVQKTMGFRVKNQYDTAEKFAWKCR